MAVVARDAFERERDALKAQLAAVEQDAKRCREALHAYEEAHALAWAGSGFEAAQFNAERRFDELRRKALAGHCPECDGSRVVPLPSGAEGPCPSCGGKAGGR
jgi:hypothetical protein